MSPCSIGWLVKAQNAWIPQKSGPAAIVVTVPMACFARPQSVFAPMMWPFDSGVRCELMPELRHDHPCRPLRSPGEKPWREGGRTSGATPKTCDRPQADILAFRHAPERGELFQNGPSSGASIGRGTRPCIGPHRRTVAGQRPQTDGYSPISPTAPWRVRFAPLPKQPPRKAGLVAERIRGLRQIRVLRSVPKTLMAVAVAKAQREQPRAVWLVRGLGKGRAAVGESERPAGSARQGASRAPVRSRKRGARFR